MASRRPCSSRRCSRQRVDDWTIAQRRGQSHTAPRSSRKKKAATGRCRRDTVWDPNKPPYAFAATLAGFDAGLSAQKHVPSCGSRQGCPRLCPDILLAETTQKQILEEARPSHVVQLTWVPSCLTMMPPAPIGCPPYTFTPRRLELESRPFFVEPAPFLCAASIRGLKQGRAAARGRGRRGAAQLQLWSCRPANELVRALAMAAPTADCLLWTVQGGKGW